MPMVDAKNKIARYEVALRYIAEAQTPTVKGIDYTEWTVMAFDYFQAIARAALSDEKEN